jgi:adenylosuccinate lyase
LERTLDDSANRRSLIPESFLAVDEILSTLASIVEGLILNPTRIKENLGKYGPFAAIERVMLAAVQNGADRQEMHEVLRQLSLAAWQEIQKGETNPLEGLVQQDERVTRWLAPDDLSGLFQIEGYTGIAESRARAMSQLIRNRFQE